MVFTVITKIPNPEKGESGNLFSGFVGIYVPTGEEVDYMEIVEPLYKSPAGKRIDLLSLRLAVFKLGEILVLNENERDIWGRKPSKWMVETEDFGTYEEAYARAKEVIEAEKQKMSRHIKHDPFARGSYHVETLTNSVCDWCGQMRARIFSYTWEDDAKSCPTRREIVHKYFCNFGEFKSYFG